MSQLNINTIRDASGGNNAVLYGVAAPSNSMGFRNRIINGDMRIDQRNNGAATANTINGFTLDRWAVNQSVTGKLIAQQSSSVAPGFSNSLSVTSQSAYNILSSDYYAITQPIEGFNFADMGWGTANAQTVTLSFRVYSSLAGTFGGSLRNGADNRGYPFSYTISAANTWATILITIPGDTTGTWIGAANGKALTVNFGLGVGSTYSGTPGAWAAGNLLSATGATSVVGTSGATFYITGVQLEAGTVASPFERRDYGRELQMCQRYCMVYSTAVDGFVRAFGFSLSSTSGVAQFYFPVTTRVPPSGATVSAASTFTLYTGASGISPSSITFDNASTKTANVTATVSGQIAYGGIILAMQNANNKIEFTGMEL